MAPNASAEASSSTSTTKTRRISGTAPGQLDASQPKRVLRHPQAKLAFAAFDPLTAINQHETDSRKRTHRDELWRSKRVVIETLPTGESFWRFVPKAKREEGVLDEGQWPRIIDLCGDQVECTEDQWDIYKLDPFYECYARAPPSLTTIRLKAPTTSPISPNDKGKRPVRPLSRSPSPSLSPRKKPHVKSGDPKLPEDEEDMAIDDSGPPPYTPHPDRARKYKEEVDKNRQERREKLNKRTEKLAQAAKDVRFDFGSPSPPSPKREIPKRKVSNLFSSLSSPDEEGPSAGEFFRSAPIYESTTNPGKRTRTLSPKSAKRDLNAKRHVRENEKRSRREQELLARRQAWHEKFLQEAFEDAPIIPPASSSPEPEDVDDDASMHPVSDEDDDDSSTTEDEEALHQAAIEASRRKLAELEKDRPLWEEQKRRREARERAEEEALRRQAEERRRAETRQADEAKRRAEAQRKAQERAEEERKQREAQQRRERERERFRYQQRWASGPWTVHRALERYKVLSDAFDSMKFSADNPVTFDMIPWPVLLSPAGLSVEDIEWSAVEKFFTQAKQHMGTVDYNSFVEKSHRRFHPDRWRSRGILKSVSHEAVRGCLEVAANTVAQALTPIWRESKNLKPQTK